VDENGAYQNLKEDASLWDENDIVRVSPVPEDFHVEQEALEILLGEIAEPEEIANLMPLNTLELAEIKIRNPVLYMKIVGEIMQISCDYALERKTFEDILNAQIRHRSCTVCDVLQSVSGKEDESDENFPSVLAFLAQGYLKNGVSLETITPDTPLSEICTLTPGREEYLKWASRLKQTGFKEIQHRSEAEPDAEASDEEYI
jgi:hypothetical protein